ncbi:MAG: DUF3617 domain-containing protein [Sphingobium sp.]|jgi:hypothetical protein|nr:DUF3617 domain-containing protein [Sphingobium sp.]MCP5399565.1 DUF3617 domain-containing protein [Sphingomonas sp.]
MRIFATLVSGVALIGLSACGKSDDQSASGDAQGMEEVASEMKKIALQPGEWETTSEIVDIQMEGAPQGMPAGALDAMKGRKTTVKKCVTPEEAANPDADFLTAQKDSQCTYSGFEMANGAIKGNVSCPGENGSTADVAMEGIYTSDSYTMTMDMDAAGMGGGTPAGMKMRMKMKISGKRVGECPA